MALEAIAGGRVNERRRPYEVPTELYLDPSEAVQTANTFFMEQEGAAMPDEVKNYVGGIASDLQTYRGQLMMYADSAYLDHFYRVLEESGIYRSPIDKHTIDAMVDAEHRALLPRDTALLQQNARSGRQTRLSALVNQLENGTNLKGYKQARTVAYFAGTMQLLIETALERAASEKLGISTGSLTDGEIPYSHEVARELKAIALTQRMLEYSAEDSRAPPEFNGGLRQAAEYLGGRYDELNLGRKHDQLQERNRDILGIEDTRRKTLDSMRSPTERYRPPAPPIIMPNQRAA